MIQFVLDAFAGNDTFETVTGLSDDVHQALDWLVGHSAEACNSYREAMVAAIEADAKRLRENGDAEKWLLQADSSIQKLCASINGPLFDLLLKASSHPDADCADLLRYGAPLLGKLPATGNTKSVQNKSHADVHDLWKSAEKGNAAVLKRLRVDPFSSELMQQALVDVGLHRLTSPVPIDEVDLSKIRVSQRFAVEQGRKKEDGSLKVRCVDSCTESGINPLFWVV